MLFEFLKSKNKIGCASIFKRAEGFYVHSNNKVKKAMWYGIAPAILISNEGSNSELGEEVRKALLRSEIVKEFPEETKGLDQFLIQAAGLKSRKQFTTDCLYCSAGLNQDIITISPSKNEGKRGFLNLDEAVEVKVDISCTDEELGLAVKSCMDKSC